MIIIFYILSVFFDAWSDGWRARSKQWHWQQACMVAVLVLSAMFYKYGFSLMVLVCGFVYVLVRIALFDDLTNAFAKRPFGYTGTHWWDKIVSKAPIGLRIFFRLIFLFLAVMIAIQII